MRTTIETFPVAADDVVLVSEGELCDPGPARLAALDAQTGSQLWQVDYPSRGPSELPAVVDGIAVVAATDGVRGVSLDGGTELWRQSIIANAAPVAGLGMVAVPVTRTRSTSWGTAETVKSLDASTGKPQWSFDLLGGRQLTGMFISSHGLVLDTWGNRVHGPSRDFIQLDPITGAQRWRTDVGVATQHWPVVVTDGVLMVPVAITSFRVRDPQSGRFIDAGPQAGVIALDEESGTEIWRHVRRENPNAVFGDRPFIAASNGPVYLRDHANVVALDAATGMEIWRRAASIGRLSAVDDLALVQSSDGTVTALRAKDGDRAWSIQLEPYARIGRAPGTVLVAQGGESRQQCGE